MVALGDVGVGAQAHLQRVVAVVGEDRVARVDAVAARRPGGEVGGQVDGCQRRFELGVEEVGEGDTLGARRRADDTVDGRLEVATGDELEHLADVDDEGVGHDRHVDELAVALDLQTGLLLVHERQEPGVAVGADPLVACVQRRPASGSG